MCIRSNVSSKGKEKKQILQIKKQQSSDTACRNPEDLCQCRHILSPDIHSSAIRSTCHWHRNLPACINGIPSWGRILVLHNSSADMTWVFSKVPPETRPACLQTAQSQDHTAHRPHSPRYWDIDKTWWNRRWCAKSHQHRHIKSLFRTEYSKAQECMPNLSFTSDQNDVCWTIGVL